MSSLPDLDDPRTAVLLATADDELVTGHRASHWTGVAPSLEEDLAFSTLAQDEINHADVWYSLIVGDDRDAIDELALGRRPEQYRHAVLCERPPRDFAYTLVRHWLYDHADAVRLEALLDSTDHEVAAVARRLRHEERYHLAHADGWLRRLARGSEPARARLRDAVAQAWVEATGLFEPVPGEDDAVATGLAPVPATELAARWLATVVPALDELGLADPVTGVTTDTDGRLHLGPGTFDEPGGRRGVHTEDWRAAWEEMTFLHRTHPGATW